MDQADLLGFAIDVLEKINVPYMVVGSLASSMFGDPRLTQDIDIVIQPTREQIDQLCYEFPNEDFYVSREAAHAALDQRGQFNVIDPESANKIDFMIARDDAWGRQQLERRQRLMLLPNRDGYVARPEDVILSKMLYYQEGGSEKHLRDITGIFKVSGEQIDRDYIQKHVKQLRLEEVWNMIASRL